MSGSPLTDAEAAKLSDEDLGRWFIESWLDFQSKIKGVPRSAEFDRAILTPTAGIDSESMKNVVLESILRKAAAGDLAAAGRMYRTERMVRTFAVEIKKSAITGSKVRKPFQEANDERHAATVDRDAELQRLASAKWAEPQHREKSAIEIAKMIDPKHYETTRRKIKKPNP
jgi:hypothetical protein